MKSRWSRVHGVPICWDRSLESLGGENLSRPEVASATLVMLRRPRAAESYGRCGSAGRASHLGSGVLFASHFHTFLGRIQDYIWLIFLT